MNASRLLFRDIRTLGIAHFRVAVGFGIKVGGPSIQVPVHDLMMSAHVENVKMQFTLQYSKRSRDVPHLRLRSGILGGSELTHGPNWLELLRYISHKILLA